MQFTHLLGKHLSYSVTSVTRHATGLRNRIGSCRNWMGYVPGDFTASDFTCKRIYRTKISHARALRFNGFYHAHWFSFLTFASEISSRLEATMTPCRRIRNTLCRLWAGDKIEHADRSVKQSTAMLSQQLLANVAIITRA